MIEDTMKVLRTIDVDYSDENIARHILAMLESQGMLPPSVEAQKIYPDTVWGGGCTMRCDCEECNPHFEVNKWEEE